MKIERLKKDNRKKIIIGVSITLLIGMGILGFIGTKAKYKYTATVPIVSGTIHYKSGDLSVLAVNIENDSGGFIETDNIPSEGYILNHEKSYCGLSNGDGTYTNEAVTMNYHDGVMAFDNISKKGTKCFLYFNKQSYLVASKTGNALNNDVLGKEIARSSFESITTVASKSVPASAIDSWDASIRQNGSIMAWYTDTNNNGLYELYIGQDGGVIANPNSALLFFNYSSVTNIDLSNLNTFKVTTMAGMFTGTKLTSLDLSNFNTSNVTDMGCMFQNMTNLTNLNLSNFDTSKVSNMAGMFYQTALTNLDLSNFNTSQVTNMQDMFQGMPSIQNLNLSTFDTSKVTNMVGMFQGMPSLKVLNLSNATFDSVTTYINMFAYSTKVPTIIVKDANAQSFINARLSEVGKTATVTIA